MIVAVVRYGDGGREQASESSEQSRGSRTNRRLRKAVHARLPTRVDGVRCRSRHDYLVIFLPVRYGHRRRFCDESRQYFELSCDLHTFIVFKPAVTLRVA